MLFNPLQVVRTTKALKNEKGKAVPSGTRLIVIRTDAGNVTARDNAGNRVTAPESSFTKTYRGRPRKDGKPVKPSLADGQRNNRPSKPKAKAQKPAQKPAAPSQSVTA